MLNFEASVCYTNIDDAADILLERTVQKQKERRSMKMMLARAFDAADFGGPQQPVQ